MSAVFSISYRGVYMRVELNTDDTINAVEVGGQDIRPLLSDLLIDDLFDELRQEAKRRAEGAA